MKQYSIPTIVFVFLSTAFIVSCHKDKESLITAANHATATSSPSNNIYFNLSIAGDSDQVFYFSKSSVVPINCNNTFCTARSRYIFQKDGTFLLQYDLDRKNEFSRGIQYKGHYKQTIVFPLLGKDGA